MTATGCFARELINNAQSRRIARAARQRPTYKKGGKLIKPKSTYKHKQGEGKVIYDSIMKNKISKSSNGYPVTPQSPNQWVVLRTLHAHEMNGRHGYTELQILGDSNKVCISDSSAFSPTVGPALKAEERLAFCKKTSACLAKLPVAERTSGVKLACSISRMRWS